MKTVTVGEKMLYIVLLGALFCITVKGYSGKKVSCNIKTNDDAFLFNLLRMAFCIAVGLAFVFFEGSQAFLFPEFKMIAICILAGAANSACLVGWMLAVRKNSMVLVDVALTLGSLLPSILCLVLFDEPFAFSKMIGFAIILLATVILSSADKQRSKKTAVGILLLILAALGDGLCGFSQQLYKHFYTESGSLTGDTVYPKTIYHLYTYAFSAVVIGAILVGYHIAAYKKSKSNTSSGTLVKKESALTVRATVHIFVMAICLFVANYLQTAATADFGMSSQLMYPIIRGGTLVTVNIVSAIFFGETMTRRKAIGSLVAILGVVVMSLV